MLQGFEWDQLLDTRLSSSCQCPSQGRTGIAATGKLILVGELLERAQEEFISACVHPDENLANIRRYWDEV